MSKKAMKWPDQRMLEITDWIDKNNATYQQAAEHFDVTLTSLSQAIRKYKIRLLKKSKVIKKQPPLTIEIPREANIDFSDMVAVMPIQSFFKFIKNN